MGQVFLSIGVDDTNEIQYNRKKRSTFVVICIAIFIPKKYFDITEFHDHKRPDRCKD